MPLVLEGNFASQPLVPLLLAAALSMPDATGVSVVADEMPLIWVSVDAGGASISVNPAWATVGSVVMGAVFCCCDGDSSPGGAVAFDCATFSAQASSAA